MLTTRWPHLLLNVWMGALLVACQSPLESTSPPIAVGITVEPFRLTPTATPECTALPQGMTVSITPLPFASTPTVSVEVGGLLPGETIALVFEARDAQHSRRIEELPSQPIGADGRYTTKARLDHLPDATSTQWQIQIIHARGVACTEITLP